MNICIYGASSEEIAPVYFEEVDKLARALARKRHSLVFGAGKYGMMGVCARAFYEEGANLIGIAPSFFQSQNCFFENCTQMIITETMRERKRIMEDTSDAFIAVPGGIGTMDELFDIMTLRQLKRHEKPIILYNVNGFWNPVLEFLDKLGQDNFMRKNAENDLYHVCSTPEEVLDLL